MTNPNIRVAHPGDIFMLLVPTAQELHQLRQWQTALQARYGGSVVDHIHITCQRFTPQDHKLAVECIEKLQTDLKSTPVFQLYTDELVQFFAPYWGIQVLRWQVQETTAYGKFRDQLDMTLSQINCPSHFNRMLHATCTAINLPSAGSIESNPLPWQFPAPLFKARELLISQLVSGEQFTILETIILPDPEPSQIQTDT